jgi:hypothetical protein
MGYPQPIRRISVGLYGTVVLPANKLSYRLRKGGWNTCAPRSLERKMVQQGSSQNGLNEHHHMLRRASEKQKLHPLLYTVPG